MSAIAGRVARCALRVSLLLACLTSCAREKHPTPLSSPLPIPDTGESPAVRTTPGALPTASALPTVVLRAHRSGSTLVSIAVVQGKRKLYTIDADSNESQRTSDGAYHSTFSKPQVTFFNQDGTKMHATSEKAEVDGTSKVVTMLGNVMLNAQDGTTMHCERLHYDNLHDAVEGWTNVVVTTKQGDTLRGEHLTGDLHLQRVHIDGVDQGT